MHMKHCQSSIRTSLRDGGLLVDTGLERPAYNRHGATRLEGNPLQRPALTAPTRFILLQLSPPQSHPPLAIRESSLTHRVWRVVFQSRRE